LAVGSAIALTWPYCAAAQDAQRGARLYLQLPAVASCVSCHGPDPSQNRNNLLFAADRPAALQKALNGVGVMGYLKSVLSDTDVADIAAYLGGVVAVATANAPIALWPTTIEFGSLALGAATPVHEVELQNLRAQALALSPARLAGPDAAHFTLETDCPTSLPPAALCRVRLRAQPTVAGPASATLLLQGTSTAAPWVTGLSVNTQGAAVAVLSTDLPGSAVAFGSLAIGAMATREFRLLSHGTAPATLGVITLTGPARAAYRVEGDCVNGLVLAPGSACTMRVQFAPIALGESRASLQWRSDATNPGTVALSGSGRAAGDSPPPTTSPPPAAPPAPAAEPVGGGGGGGCAGGPPVRRVDPLMPLLVVLAWAALWLRGRPRLVRRSLTHWPHH